MKDFDPEYFDETWDECPQCGAVFGGDEYINQRCYACGWENGNEVESEDDDDFGDYE